MNKEYFEYLSKISWKGLLYRRLIVYPIIRKYCNGTVLDVGCGMGQFVKHCRGSKGVDINTDCVEFCQKHGLDVVKMEIDRLPFEDSSYDTVVLDNVLEHIMDPTPLLNECARVLKRNGILIILVPGQKGFKRDADHKKFYDHNALRELTKVNNFVPFKCISLPILKLDKVLSAFCFMIVAYKPRLD